MERMAAFAAYFICFLMLFEGIGAGNQAVIWISVMGIALVLLLRMFKPVPEAAPEDKPDNDKP